LKLESGHLSKRRSRITRSQKITERPSRALPGTDEWIKRTLSNAETLIVKGLLLGKRLLLSGYLLISRVL
jgi:hypothetical protein